MIGESRAAAEEIIREGGVFWYVEVENTDAPGTFRILSREEDSGRTKSELKFHRDRDELGRTFRAREMTITSEVMNW